MAQRDKALFQEGDAKIVVIFDEPAAEGAAYELFNVHHDVEGSVRRDAADAGDAVQAGDEIVAPLLKHLAHGLDRLLRTAQRLDGGPLADRGGCAGAVAEVVGHDLGELFVRRGVAMRQPVMA